MKCNFAFIILLTVLLWLTSKFPSALANTNNNNNNNFGTATAISDEIHFVYPGDPDVQALGLERFDLIFWKDSQKVTLCKLLILLKRRFPEFLPENPEIRLSVGRVKKFSSADTYAKTISNAILLSDSFFEPGEDFQITTLLHELIHYNDCGQARSLSNEWVRFMQNNKMAKADSFAEALASFTTEQLLSKREKDALTLLTRIFSQNDKYLEFSKHYRTAVSAKEVADYKGAIRELRAAVKIESDVINAHALLTFCYMKARQNELAAKESDLFIRMIKSRALRFTQPEIYRAILLRYELLLAMNRREDAVRLVEQILKEKPEEKCRFKSIETFQSNDHLF